MKPGDHPEFFRFAPPPGTSRESTLRLDARGRFSHDGEPVEPRALEEALHRWIARHPDDGRFILSNGYDWCYFTVEATPYLVKGVLDGAAPRLALDDGSIEHLDPVGLRVEADGALVARVKGGGFDAKFTPSAQRELGPWLEEGAAGPCLAIAGTTYPLPLGQTCSDP